MCDFMKKAIAVIGSSRDLPEGNGVKKNARQLGIEIAKKNLALVTGACIGFPDIVAQGAKKAGGLSIGISPAVDLEDHINNWNYPIKSYDHIVFTGMGRARNFLVTRAAQAVILVGGRIGSLNEFSFAFDESKPIGILKGTGGLTENIEQIIEFCRKKTRTEFFYSENPRNLVKQMADFLAENSK